MIIIMLEILIFDPEAQIMCASNLCVCGLCSMYDVRQQIMYVRSLFARICQMCTFGYVCAASLALLF